MARAVRRASLRMIWSGMDLSLCSVLILGLSAMIAGIAKTGVPGLGVVLAALVAMAMPAKESTGYILPFLIVGDFIAVFYWRSKALWPIIISVLPAMAVGIVAGYCIMGGIDDAVYGKALGGMVLFLAGLDWLCRYFKIPMPRNSRVFGYAAGLMAGVLTMLANAAGAVMVLYLLAMRISKEEFVGTGAWLFLFVNLFKVPFSVSLGLITLESLKMNLMLLPCMLLGCVLGVVVLRKLSGRAFEVLVRGLAVLGGLKLLFF